MTSRQGAGDGPPSPLALSRGTVDRVTLRRNDADWIDRAWKDPGTRVLVVLDGQALVRDVDDRPELVFLARNRRRRGPGSCWARTTTGWSTSA